MVKSNTHERWLGPLTLSFIVIQLVLCSQVQQHCPGVKPAGSTVTGCSGMYNLFSKLAYILY